MSRIPPVSGDIEIVHGTWRRALQAWVNCVGRLNAWFSVHILWRECGSDRVGRPSCAGRL